jgi:hypothetical protein
MKKLLPVVAAVSFGIVTGCGNSKSGPGNASVKSAWDSADAPQRIGLKNRDYEPNLDRLPKEARLKEIPWSGDYWPTHKGGITYRWNHSSEDDDQRIFFRTKKFDDLTADDIRQMSPAEKWDLYLGDRSYSMTRAERERTQVLRLRTDPNFEIPYWEGLCHSWAPATHLYRNPGAVTLKGATGVEIPFGSSDIQALLTYHLHDSSAVTYFVSRRCNIDQEDLHDKMLRGEISNAEYLRQINSAECEGVNAGAFHIILTNLLSKNESFIVDVTRYAEVWNQAVHGFKARQLSETKKIHPDSAPGTVREVLMETEMFYTVEIPHAWDRTVTLDSEAVKKYQYWLELDRANNIIGGRWQSEDRPDFAWRQTLPEFAGYWKPLKNIYEASIADLPGQVINGPATPGQPQTKRFGPLSWIIKEKAFFTKIAAAGKLPEGTASARFEVRTQDGTVRGARDIAIMRDGSFSVEAKLFPRVTEGVAVIRAYDKNKALIGEETRSIVPMMAPDNEVASN